MPVSNKPSGLAKEFARKNRKQELKSICKEVVDREIARGRIKRPNSMRNLRRWLGREVAKREGWCASRERFMKAAAVLLLMSGLILSGGPTGVSKAQAAQTTFTEQIGAANPLNGFDPGYSAAPVFVDIDSDGDLDAFTGDGFISHIHFYQNIGNSVSPDFTELTGADNPLDLATYHYGYVVFADLDADGDMDSVVTDFFAGDMEYYENIGNSVSPEFAHLTGAANPLNGIVVPSDPVFSAPFAAFTDIDADGDLDLFIGEYNGTVIHYENTGSAQNPLYEERTGTDNPFDGVDVGGYSTPVFTDMDSDGDMDALIGELYGAVIYYENTGSPQDPTFTERTGAQNPFDGVDVGLNSASSFVDIDADGDQDSFVGESDGTIYFYENDSTPVAPSFTEITGADNPFNNEDVGTHSAPTFVDIDADGDLDAFVGEYYGSVKYYENIGNSVSPQFTERTADLNPLKDVRVDEVASPTFVDIDADGDFDAFIGDSYTRKVFYYENTGTPQDPFFEERTGGLNPLNGVTDYYMKPVFADIDSDGDQDFFVGDFWGTVKYYENTGSVVTPTFTARTGALNPMNGFDLGLESPEPDFLDMDSDGDLDAVLGWADGTLRYYENIGNSVSPDFTERIGAHQNPLEGFDVGYASTPVFVDIDSDGDMDMFVGELSGNINYFEQNRYPTFNKTSTINGKPVEGLTVGLNIDTFDADGDTLALSYQR